MVPVVVSGYGNPSSKLEKTVCISRNADTLEKGMNQFILSLGQGRGGDTYIYI